MVPRSPPLSAAFPVQVAKPSELLTELVQWQRAGEAQPGTARPAEDLPVFRERIAESFRAWLPRLKPQPEGGELEAASALLSALAEAGGNDHPSSDALVAMASVPGTPPLLRLLQWFALVPAWQGQAPRLADVPSWLLPLAATYVFSGPRLLTTPGQDRAFALRAIEALQDLAKLARANRGSAGLRGAIMNYRRAPALPPAWAGALWPEYAAARGALMALFGPANEHTPFLIPREGRKLRLAVIGEALAPEGAVASLLPLVERLDPTRFELLVFTLQGEGTPAVEHLRRRGADHVPLPDSVPDALQALQDALLDVAILVSEPAEHSDFGTQLERQRVAWLQVLHDGLQESPELAEMDLFLCGSGPAAPRPAGARGRALLLPGAGPLAKSDLEPVPGDDLKRSELGLGGAQPVLVSFAALAALSPETQAAWARVLARVPQARLILSAASGSAPDAAWLERFCAQFDVVLAREGARSDQLLVFPEVFRSYAARRNIVAIADAVLDAFGSSDPEGALAASERGVPALALAAGPRRAQRAAGLLRLAGLGELAPDTAEAYVEAAVRLCTDAPWRTGLGQRWFGASASLAALHDSFAQSEACGRLLEQAFDQVVADRAAFKAAAAPLAGPTAAVAEPALAEARILAECGVAGEAARRARLMLAARPDHPEARRVLARALRLDQHHALVADLLLTQVRLQPNEAAAWLELALAAAQAGRADDAFAAANQALALDARLLDAWLLLARFEGAPRRAEVVRALRTLAPEDPRVREALARGAD